MIEALRMEGDFLGLKDYEVDYLNFLRIKNRNREHWVDHYEIQECA